MHRHPNMLRTSPICPMLLAIWHVANEHVANILRDLCRCELTSLFTLPVQSIQGHHLQECARNLLQMVYCLWCLLGYGLYHAPRQEASQFLFYASDVCFIHHVPRGSCSHSTTSAFASEQGHRRSKFLLPNVSWCGPSLPSRILDNDVNKAWLFLVPSYGGRFAHNSIRRFLRILQEGKDKQGFASRRFPGQNLLRFVYYMNKPTPMLK